MPSLNYEEIYSKFRLKAEAYDILQYREDDVSAVFMPEYLHASINKPYIRRLFSELKLGDTVQELTYIMKYSVDDDFDAEFITDILGIGMVIEWITPKINSLNNTQQVFGSSEEKFYSQTNHLNGLKDLKKSLIKEQKNLIKDRGYIWNSYLDGSNTSWIQFTDILMIYKLKNIRKNYTKKCFGFFYIRIQKQKMNLKMLTLKNILSI